MVEEDSPRLYIERGYKLPAKSWFDVGGWKSCVDKTPAPARLYGAEDSVRYLTNYRVENGPFDGVLTFS